MVEAAERTMRRAGEMASLSDGVAALREALTGAVASSGAALLTTKEVTGFHVRNFAGAHRRLQRGDAEEWRE